MSYSYCGSNNLCDISYVNFDQGYVITERLYKRYVTYKNAQPGGNGDKIKPLRAFLKTPNSQNSNYFSRNFSEFMVESNSDSKNVPVSMYLDFSWS